MAYITLEELEKILPGILDQWIDKDDESWEWIFQEIEQKCHVGKKEKKKKKKNKYNKEEWIKRNRVDIDTLIDKFQSMDEDLKIAKQYNTQLSLTIKDTAAEIRHIREDIKAAKSMAETAKQRTEVDYSKYSGKSGDEKMCSTCKYSSNIDGSPKSFDEPPCNLCNYNNKWEAKDE